MTTRRAGELHRLAGHLVGDLAAAGIVLVVDHGSDGRDDVQLLTLRRARLEAVRELFGDEAGRQRALAPARVLHQRGEERDVVLDAVDIEGCRAPRPGHRSPPRASGAWVTSLAIIGS